MAQLLLSDALSATIVPSYFLSSGKSASRVTSLGDTLTQAVEMYEYTVLPERRYDYRISEYSTPSSNDGRVVAHDELIEKVGRCPYTCTLS